MEGHLNNPPRIHSTIKESLEEFLLRDITDRITESIRLGANRDYISHGSYPQKLTGITNMTGHGNIDSSSILLLDRLYMNNTVDVGQAKEDWRKAEGIWGFISDTKS